MENFLFGIGDIFTFFDTDKAVTLVFDLGSIEETTNTEEAGFFAMYLLQLFIYLNIRGLNDRMSQL